jgi:hypothetical protein
MARKCYFSLMTSVHARRFDGQFVVFGFDFGVRRLAQRTGERFLHCGATYTLIPFEVDREVACGIVYLDCYDLIRQCNPPLPR